MLYLVQTQNFCGLLIFSFSEKMFIFFHSSWAPKCVVIFPCDVPVIRWAASYLGFTVNSWKWWKPQPYIVLVQMSFKDSLDKTSEWRTSGVLMGSQPHPMRWSCLSKNRKTLLWFSRCSFLRFSLCDSRVELWGRQGRSKQSAEFSTPAALH